MPRYGEKATLYPPGSLAVFRWRLVNSIGPGGVAIMESTRDPEMTDLASLSGTAWNRWEFSAVDAGGLSTAETLARLSGAATLTLASGADSIVLAATLPAAYMFTHQSTGDVYEFSPLTGKTSTPSPGAAVADWTGAEVTLAAGAEAAPESLWVEALDADALSAPPPDPEAVIATQFAREAASLETRWRAGVLAGRTLRWRDRFWQVLNSEEDGRRRRLRLDVVRTATF